MSKMSVRLRYVGTIVAPKGVINPYPRQYFDIGRGITDGEAKLLEVHLQTACKHISKVAPCQITPHGELCSFYISYGGLDPTPGCTNTQRRLKKYLGDVLDTISNLTMLAV